MKAYVNSNTVVAVTVSMIFMLMTACQGHNGFKSRKYTPEEIAEERAKRSLPTDGDNKDSEGPGNEDGTGEQVQPPGGAAAGTGPTGTGIDNAADAKTYREEGKVSKWEVLKQATYNDALLSNKAALAKKDGAADQFIRGIQFLWTNETREAIGLSLNAEMVKADGQASVLEVLFSEIYSKDDKQNFIDSSLVRFKEETVAPAAPAPTDAPADAAAGPGPAPAVEVKTDSNHVEVSTLCANNLCNQIFVRLDSGPTEIKEENKIQSAVFLFELDTNAVADKANECYGRDTYKLIDSNTNLAKETFICVASKPATIGQGSADVNPGQGSTNVNSGAANAGTVVAPPPVTANGPGTTESMSAKSRAAYEQYYKSRIEATRTQTNANTNLTNNAGATNAAVKVNTQAYLDYAKSRTGVPAAQSPSNAQTIGAASGQPYAKFTQQPAAPVTKAQTIGAASGQPYAKFTQQPAAPVTKAQTIGAASGQPYAKFTQQPKAVTAKGAGVSPGGTAITNLNQKPAAADLNRVQPIPAPKQSECISTDKKNCPSLHPAKPIQQEKSKIVPKKVPTQFENDAYIEWLKTQGPI